jgi:hypothetical protein
MTNLKKLVVAFALLGNIITQVHAEYDLLKNRKAMVNAIAWFAAASPKCFLDYKKPSTEEVKIFVKSYGYEPDEAFWQEVAAEMRRDEQMLESLFPNKTVTLADIRNAREIRCKSARRTPVAGAANMPRRY